MYSFKSKSVLVLALALIIMAGSVLAQPGRMGNKLPPKHGNPEMICPHKGHFLPHPDTEHFPPIPNLTDQQKEQLKKLHISNLKAMLPLKNQSGEYEARLRTLITAEKVDMQSINKLIEDIGSIKIKMMKEKAAQHQEIRKLLSEEQRAIFDNRPPRLNMTQHIMR